MSYETTCYLMGGLGNQIFQIFATISCAINTKKKFTFQNNLSIQGITKRHTYWDNFFARLKPFLNNNSTPPRNVEESGFNYDPTVIERASNSKNTVLFGYFQNEKYFKENYDIICRIIGLDDMKNYVKTKLKDLDCEEINIDHCVSLHFRMGDYKMLQYFHTLTPYEYYENALSLILEQRKTSYLQVIYFFEEEDIEVVASMVNRLQQKYPLLQFIPINKEMKDWEQLLMMSLCRDNIIANSSFSWWGAYFNSHSDKIVTYPKLWFAPNVKTDVSGLCPDTWYRIDYAL